MTACADCGYRYPTEYLLYADTPWPVCEHCAAFEVQD